MGPGPVFHALAFLLQNHCHATSLTSATVLGFSDIIIINIIILSITGLKNCFQYLKFSRALAASRALVFVLWLYFRGHACWTGFFVLSAIARRSKRLQSTRAGRTALRSCFCAIKKSTNFPPESHRLGDVQESRGGRKRRRTPSAESFSMCATEGYFAEGSFPASLVLLLLFAGDVLSRTPCSNVGCVTSTVDTVSHSLGRRHVFLEHFTTDPYPLSLLLPPCQSRQFGIILSAPPTKKKSCKRKRVTLRPSCTTAAQIRCDSCPSVSPSPATA